MFVNAMVRNVLQQTHNTNNKYNITVLLKSSTPIPGLWSELVLTNVVSREIVSQAVFSG
jgi:hypothetical protein